MQYQLNVPTLILGMGMPGVGKTKVLKEIARRLTNSVLIQKDTLNKAFARRPVYDKNNPLVCYRRYEEMPRDKSGFLYVRTNTVILRNV